MFLGQISWEAEVICTNNRSNSNKCPFAGVSPWQTPQASLTKSMWSRGFHLKHFQMFYVFSRKEWRFYLRTLALWYFQQYAFQVRPQSTPKQHLDAPQNNKTTVFQTISNQTVNNRPCLLYRTPPISTSLNSSFISTWTPLYWSPGLVPVPAVPASSLTA